MPDISNKASHEYWFEYKDPTIYRVVSFMEGVEDWTLDGEPELEEAMARLGEALENIDGVELQQEEEFVKLLAYLKAARMLRIMQCLDMANPGSASKLLMYAEQNTSSTEDFQGLFLRRNVVFERLRLLGRVFAKPRLELLKNALEEA